MKKTLLTISILVFSFFAKAQSAGDFQSAGTGLWHEATSWLKHDGSNWNMAVAAPSNLDGVITIKNGHTITVNTPGSPTPIINIDQTIVELGATLETVTYMVVRNGSGDDLIINGVWNPGGLLGGIQGVLTGATSLIVVSSSGVLNISKNTYWGGYLSNFGTINWSDGDITSPAGSQFTGAAGARVDIINNGNWNITCDRYFGALLNQRTGTLITNNGNITKTIITPNTIPNSYKGFFLGQNFLNTGNITVNNCNMGFYAETIYNTGTITLNSGSISNSFNGLIGMSGVSGNGSLSFRNAVFSPLSNYTLPSTITLSIGGFSVGTGIVFTNNSIISNYGAISGTGTFINNNEIYNGNAAISIANYINNGKIKGTGTINITSPNFTNNGTISPGNSPGLLTINGAQPFSANTVLEIEMFSGAAAGTGYDQLARAGNLTLAGTLTVTETGTVPDGIYTILNLTSGIITGNFATVNLPNGYTLTQNSNNIQLVKANPLPLTLLSFSAKQTENGNELKWKTTNETNFSHFEIQRSDDAKKFEKIGEKYSDELNNYEFLDNSQFATQNSQLFYRLKLIDLDGKYSYSKIISIQNETKFSFSINPNPVIDNLNISANVEESGNYQIKIFNEIGQVKSNQNRYLKSGNNSISIPVDSFQKGMYFAVIQGDMGLNKILKFIK